MLNKRKIKMEHYDVIIIGGGPAGVTCAISARNTYPDKKIALIRKESIPMIPCGIPYTLNTLNSVDDNILPDTPLKNAAVRIIEEEVIDINRIENKLELKSGKKLSFEKLVLATGSKPIQPKIEGIEKEGVYLVKKDRDYLVGLRKESAKANNILVVGGGYIGVEIADELLKAGKNVTLVEKMDCLLPVSMDEEFGMKAKEILEELGGKVILNRGVGKFTGDKNIDGAILDDGERVSADLAIVSVGYVPNTKLAEKFGIDFDEKKGILVDEYLRTSLKNIFAIGDCSAKSDFFTGDSSNIMLASTAMAEGRLVGSNLFSIKVIRKYQGVLGSFSTKLGDVAFGVSGINERRAKEKGLDYTIGEASAIDRHPGKLPGGSTLHLKLIFSTYSHTLLGAEMYGGNSVGELVNMFSVMILNKMTDMDIDTLQIGTHPLLTASPIAYPVINATVDAIKKWYVYHA